MSNVLQTEKKIKCPYCGAGYKDLIADVLIVACADITEDGKLMPHSYTDREIAARMEGTDVGDVRLYCHNCGADNILVDFDDNGKLTVVK